MTILNNFKKLVYLCFGAPRYSYLTVNPSSSIDPNNCLTFESASSLYVISTAVQPSSGKTYISSLISKILSYATAGDGNYLANHKMAPARFSFITEDFDIVDNNYIANSAGGVPAIDNADTVTMGSSFHNLKQTYNMTINNTTAEAITLYGIEIEAMTVVYTYQKSTQSWLTGESQQLFPIWVVKFDQPKVLQPGESLTVSYSIDFSNLIDEVNDVAVTQQ